jgi:T4 RnlA family RNA ligase
MKFTIMEKLTTPLAKTTSLFEYIEAKPFDQIKDELGAEPLNIKVNDKGNLYICKYSQIDSDFSYKIVRQCRGIILEKVTNKIVAYPFDKFFNIQEGHADKVDFGTASIQEKVDGSIIKVYYYDNKWNVATNGTIDAKDAETTDSLTGKKANFYDLFLDGIEEQGITFSELTKKMAPDLTYIFELVHPITRVVIKYEKPGVYLIGIRNNKTGKEVNTFDDSNETVKNITGLGIKRPKTFQFASTEEMIAAAEQLTKDEEGYVVRDSEFRRVKVKSPLYLKLHYLKSNNELTPKHFIELIQKNETDEFLSAFPEYKPKIDEIREKLEKYISEVQKDWKFLENAFLLQRKFDSKDRKEFAEVAKKTINSGAMFKTLDMYLRGENNLPKFITKYIMEMQSDKLMAVIGV